MTLKTIDIPDTINRLSFAEGAEHLIDTANEAIEAFMLADQKVIENSVTCDFHLLDQAMTWIEENHLLTGNRFCEFGAGFGVGAMLAALRGMESIAWGQNTQPSNKHWENRAFKRWTSVDLSRTDMLSTPAMFPRPF